MTRWLALCAVLVMGCSSAGPSIPEDAMDAGDRGPGYGEVLFPAPGSEKNAAYLGLKNPAAPFRLGQVRAGLLVVEIFDMYCIHCQRSAPDVNRFFRELERAGLGERIKMVGVGRKNSEIEVEVYRDRYEVPFPLFPDPTLSLTGALGLQKAGTPHFVVLDLQENAVVADSNTGAFRDPKKFLERIRKHLAEKEN